MVPRVGFELTAYRLQSGDFAIFRRFASLAESAKTPGFLRQTTLYNDR